MIKAFVVSKRYHLLTMFFISFKITVSNCNKEKKVNLHKSNKKLVLFLSPKVFQRKRDEISRYLTTDVMSGFSLIWELLNLTFSSLDLSTIR